MSHLHRSPTMFLAVLGSAFAVEGALYSAVSPVLPLLTRRFSLSDSVAGLLLSGYSAGIIAGSLICVFILRKANARDVAVAGLVALAATTLVFAWGGHAAILVSSRLGAGIAGGVTWTACITWLLDVWPEERRGAALGASASYGVVGTIGGPMIGTLAVQLGVRGPYTAVAVLCTAIAGLLVVMPRPAGRRQEVVRQNRLSARARTLALLAGGVLALLGVVIGLVNVAGPLVLTRLGAPDVFAGFVFLAAAGLSVGTGRPTGSLIDRVGTRGPLVAALLLLAVLLPLLGVGLDSFTTGCIVVALLMGVNACFIATATMLTSTGEAAGWSLRFATALIATVWGIGETLGAMLAGVGLDMVGPAFTTAVGGALLGLGAVVLVVLTRRRYGGHDGSGVHAASDLRSACVTPREPT